MSEVNNTARGWTRRQVLLAGAAVAAGSSVTKVVSAADGSRSESRSLVLLHLSGGNDGLNTVIPIRDPLYYELRPRLSRVGREALAIDAELGLHPSMPAMARLYERGRLAIVQGVGYPDPDYSHFGSCRIWSTGRPEGGSDPAWWDEACGGGAALKAAVVVGDREPPVRMATRNLVRIRAGREKEDSSRPQNPLPWRPGDTGRILAAIARLVRARRPPGIIFASVGGYDTHENQLEQHARVLGDLSESLGEFQRELERYSVASRVLTMVWSEFGRRPAENALGGTDHGSAAPVFVLGEAVRGGLHGRMPSLAETDGGNLVPKVDFRGLYTALEDCWLSSRSAIEPV